MILLVNRRLEGEKEKSPWGGMLRKVEIFLTSGNLTSLVLHLQRKTRRKTVQRKNILSLDSTSLLVIDWDRLGVKLSVFMPHTGQKHMGKNGRV